MTEIVKSHEEVMTHRTKTVANEGEVIVDNDRVVRERNPELDKLIEYLDQMSELMKQENDELIKKSLWNGTMTSFIYYDSYNS